MLAHYAEYANIGGNKTAAYGQTKLSVGVLAGKHK